MDNITQDGNRMVYGLGTCFVHCCGAGGTWRQKLPEVLKSFKNPVLISTGDITKTSAEVIYQSVGTNRLYLDSGGYTLWRKEQSMGSDNLEFHKLCEKMRKKFFGILEVCKPQEVFELDNEYFRKDEDLLSPLNYCRQEVYDVLGFYPTPVFKVHQGFEYWKRLCESELYPKLAIGGFAATKSWGKVGAEVKIMMDYARQYGKKVHLLGCANLQTFKDVQPDTIDYSIIQYAINVKRVRDEDPTRDTFAKQRPHIVAYALAAAHAKCFLYDGLWKTWEQEKQEMNNE